MIEVIMYSYQHLGLKYIHNDGKAYSLAAMFDPRIGIAIWSSSLHVWHRLNIYVHLYCNTELTDSNGVLIGDTMHDIVHIFLKLHVTTLQSASYDTMNV